MKKFMKKTAAILAATLAVSGIAAVSSFAVVGDIDGNNKANSGDARLVLRYAAKLENDWTQEQITKADLNADGKINSSDARMLLRAAAKLDTLDYYKNFYVETATDGQDVAIGFYNGSYLAKTDMFGQALNMILNGDGSIVFVDDSNKRYGMITKDEIDALAKLTGEAIDFSEIATDMNETAKFPTPAYLLDQGYQRTEEEWQGKTATKYTKDISNANQIAYYYNGMTLLGVVTIKGGQADVTEFRNFTTSCESYFTSYKSYACVDFIELIMDIFPME